ATGGLHDLLHSRVEVGVIVAMGFAEHLLHSGFDFFVDHIDLRQTEGGDKGTDQTFAGQVDALAKSAAQHGKANAFRTQGEAVEKGLPLAFQHVSGLHAGGDVRVQGFEKFAYLLQVGIAAEKGQV